MPPNDDRVKPNGDGMASPRVFDTLEEAVAATTPEDDYLDSLDQPDGDDDESQ